MPDPGDMVPVSCAATIASRKDVETAVVDPNENLNYARYTKAVNPFFMPMSIGRMIQVW